MSKEVTAIGEWVVLKMVEIEAKQEKTASGFIMPGKKAKGGQNINDPTQSGKIKVQLYVHSIGDEAKLNAKIGDRVFIDDYDAQSVSDGENIYVICHYKKVKCVITDTDTKN